jgi:hypothetical protein
MSAMPKSNDAAQVTLLKIASRAIGGRSTEGHDAKSASTWLPSVQRPLPSATGQVKHCHTMDVIRTEMVTKAQILGFRKRGLGFAAMPSIEAEAWADLTTFRVSAHPPRVVARGLYAPE